MKQMTTMKMKRRNTFNQLKRTRQRCLTMVSQRARLSATAALMPLPGVDVCLDAANLLTLTTAINHRFGLTPEQLARLKPERRTRIILLSVKVGNGLIGRVITRRLLLALLRKFGVKIGTKTVAKFVPVVGQIASSAISFGMMKIVGAQHVNACYRIMHQVIDEEKF